MPWCPASASTTMNPPAEPPSRAALQAAASQRLHPLSWLFLLLAQLRAFALPLLVLLFGGGRREDGIADLIGLLAAGLLALTAVWRYFTYHYGFLGQALVIRSGLLQRNLRLVPFDRVQNVTVHQNLLHRLFGVASVRLESAGGLGQAEAQMDVLRLDQARALEALVRQGAQRARAAAAASGEGPEAATPAEPAPVLWLHLPMRELVRLGLISNRGMLVVAALFAALSQAGDAVMKPLGNQLYAGLKEGESWAASLHLGPLAYGLASLLLLLGLLALVRALSVALAIVQFHDFRLLAGERELSVERGLLSRVRAHLPKRRVQAYTLHESLLHRWFGRRSLSVDRAALETGNEAAALRELVPLATPEAMDGMLQRLLPEGSWPPRHWQPLHPRAWRRVAFPGLLATLAASGLLVAWKGLPGLWLLLLLPLVVLRARIWARYSAWSLEGGVISVRQGWLDRHWRFAEVRKLHALELRQSPFDRRHGMASLHLDSLGAHPMAPPLRIPYLPVAEAVRLAAALRAGMPRDAGVSRARTAA